jgi:hypothetical protein
MQAPAGAGPGTRMDRRPVKSSKLRAAGYDPVSQVLEVELADGKVVRYRDVPESMFAGLTGTPTPDHYFQLVQEYYTTS